MDECGEVRQGRPVPAPCHTGMRACAASLTKSKRGRAVLMQSRRLRSCLLNSLAGVAPSLYVSCCIYATHDASSVNFGVNVDAAHACGHALHRADKTSLNAVSLFQSSSAWNEQY